MTVRPESNVPTSGEGDGPPTSPPAVTSTPTDGMVRAITEHGSAADVPVHRADREDGAYVVVGRRGLGAAPPPLGSVSESVLGRSSRPDVVVVATDPT